MKKEVKNEPLYPEYPELPDLEIPSIEPIAHSITEMERRQTYSMIEVNVCMTLRRLFEEVENNIKHYEKNK